MKLLFLSLSLLLFVATLYSTLMGANAFSVTVVGGTGFVGSRVCKLLTEEHGASVTSVSKSGKVPDWCYQEDQESSSKWYDEVTWKSVDLLSEDDAKISSAIGNPDALVSCVGVVGTDPKELIDGNGKTNVAAFSSAVKGNIKHAAFVSVSGEVSDLKGSTWLPDFMDAYFDGKGKAEEAALDAVGGDSSRLVIVKPSFIYGGDSFGLFPPRVNYAYGSGVEELLTFGLFRFLGDATPGLIKVALRPPVSVDAVAGACAAAAMGKVPGGVLEGTREIKAVTNDPPAKGLTEAIDWLKGKTIKFIDWTKVEVPKAINEGKRMIDENK